MLSRRPRARPSGIHKYCARRPRLATAGFRQAHVACGELRAARDESTPRRVERQAPRSTAVSTSRVLEDLHATRRVTIRASRPRPDRRRGQAANPRSQTAQAVARAEALMTQKPRDLLAVCRSTRLRETCKAHLAGRDRRVRADRGGPDGRLGVGCGTRMGPLRSVKSKGHYEDSNCSKEDFKENKAQVKKYKGKFEWVPGAAAACFAQKHGKYKDAACTRRPQEGRIQGQIRKNRRPQIHGRRWRRRS